MFKFLTVFALLLPFICLAQEEKDLIERNVISQLITTSDNKGNVSEKEEFRYDTKGNLIEEIKYENGKEVEKISYSYDDKNNKVEEVHYEYGKKRKIFKYEYDGCLRTKKLYLDENGKLKKTKTYTYTFGK